MNFANVIIELELTEYAPHFLELLGPFRGQAPNNGLAALGTVALHLGGLSELMGRYDEAEPYFAESLEIATRGGLRNFECRTLVSWSRMLCKRETPGNVERAGDMLERARSISAEYGYASIERQAEAALSDLG
jgi:hypothetical protein